MALSDSGSRTAMTSAAYRARATERDPAWCNDPWAKFLSGDEGLDLIKSIDRVLPEFEVGVATRTEFLDRVVRKWTGPEEPIRQVVLLGAGFDTRSVRLATSSVKYFELDHPVTQQQKRDSLGSAPGYPVEQATYVPCDFEEQDFLVELGGAGFVADAPALVVWEGVTGYLTEEAVRTALRSIAEGMHEASIVAFDFLTPGMREASSNPAGAEATRMARKLGEPLHFMTEDPTPMLYELGFRRVRTTSMVNACLLVTGTYDPTRRALSAWGLCVASRAAPVDAI